MRAPRGSPLTTAGLPPAAQETRGPGTSPWAGGPVRPRRPLRPGLRGSAPTHVQPEVLCPLAHRLVAAAARAAVGRLILEDVVAPRSIPVLVEHHGGPRAAWSESQEPSAGPPVSPGEAPRPAQDAGRREALVQRGSESWGTSPPPMHWRWPRLSPPPQVTSLGSTWGQWDPDALLVGMQNSAVTVESSVAGPPKTGRRITT